MYVLRERNKNRKYFRSFPQMTEMSILSHICFKQRDVPPFTVRHETPVSSQQKQRRYTTAGRLSSSAWYDQKHFSPLKYVSFAFVLPFNRTNKKIIFECGRRNLRFLYVSLSLSFFLKFLFKETGNLMVTDSIPCVT